jgi:protease-4
MQALVNGFHAYFVEIVMKERGLSPQAMETIADGRLFTGREAVEFGLADRIGDLDAAIRHAAELAGLPDEDPRIIRVHSEQPFLPRLLQQIESASASVRNSWLLPKYVMR